ncbi:MAG: TolC family protein [Gammaproteobacteria bacterium]|nr:TolC family protein [Gammaproteobacteria bacterium]
MHSMNTRRVLLGACLFAQALLYNRALAAEPAPSVAQQAAPAVARFVSESLATHPMAQASDATRDAAQARVQAAGQPLYNPELELGSERTASRTRTLGLNLTLDLSGKRTTRAAAAQYELEAAESERAFTRQTLATQLLADLARHQAARHIETLAQRQVELMERFAQFAEKSHAAGDVGRVEVDLAHLALSEARARRGEIQTERLASEEALRAASSLPPDAWPALPDLLPDVPRDAPQDIAASAPIEQLAELKAQRARVDAARARVRMAQAEGRPDPTLGVRGGREDDDTLTGVTLSVPLFVRNSYRAEVAAASQDALREEFTEQDVQRRARVRLDGALQRYRGAWRTWHDWQATDRASLATRAQQLESLWQAGELSATDYLVQVQQSIDAEIQALRVWSTAWNAWFDWLTASGGVDAWLGSQTTLTARDSE